MTHWEEQNAAEWRKISFALQTKSRSGVFWITCDQFQHRQGLLESFQERFPDYDHTIGKIDRFEGGSLPQYLIGVFTGLGGKSESERPQIFHVSGLERYLSHTSDAGKGGFFEALNFERPIFYRSLPFILVFWTDSQALVRAHRLAPDFWEWLTHKYEFEGPKDQLIQDATIGQDWANRYWEPLDPDEAELLHNRNARLLASLEEQRRDADRLSIWIGLADNYDRLRDFSNSLHYRRLALAYLKDQDQESYHGQLGALALTSSRFGNLIFVQGDLDGARALYDEALGLLPTDGLWKERASILSRLGVLEQHLGNLDVARALYEEAIIHYKNVRSNLGLAAALQGLGDLERQLENVDRARALFEEAIGHYKNEQDNLGLADALSRLGDLERYRGNLDGGRALYEEAISHYKNERNNLGLANALSRLGNLERHLGNLDGARALFEEAIWHYKNERSNLGLANALQSLGELECRLGNVDRGRALYEEAISHYITERSSQGLANCYAAMARLSHKSGQREIRDKDYAQAIHYATASNLPVVLEYVQSIGKAWIKNP